MRKPHPRPFRIGVNGRQVEQRTALRNGYRLLVGSNRFFRVNCPRDVLSPLAQQQATTSAAAMSAFMTSELTEATACLLRGQRVNSTFTPLIRTFGSSLVSL